MNNGFNGFYELEMNFVYFLRKRKRNAILCLCLTFRASIDSSAMPCIDFRDQNCHLLRSEIDLVNINSMSNFNLISTSIVGLEVSIATSHPVGPGSIPGRCNSFLLSKDL